MNTQGNIKQWALSNYSLNQTTIYFDKFYKIGAKFVCHFYFDIYPKQNIIWLMYNM